MIDPTIRADFPLLQQEPRLVYFDNACMSLRPTRVIEAITYYYTHLSACAGRSNHHLASKVTKAVEEARENVRQLIGAKHADEIVFTRNTSEGMNLVAYAIGLRAGDTVVISDKEHNSNLVPWLQLKSILGIRLIIVPSMADNQANLEAWKEAIGSPRVKLVSVVGTSNLDGVSNPVREIARIAHAVGALVLMDAAQTVPHQPIAVQDLDVDFMAFSAHKMCGPSGMGALYGKRTLLAQLNPFLVGGDTVANTTYESFSMLPVPEKFEAGLQNYAGIMGFGAAVDYLLKVGLAAIHEHELHLNKVLTQGLQQFDRVKIIGPEQPELRGGITSFTVDGADHHQIALMLDQMGSIAVRSGQHCVHSWFNAKHIKGSVRASVYFYNTVAEVERFLEVFSKIMRIV